MRFKQEKSKLRQSCPVEFIDAGNGNSASEVYADVG